MAKQRERRPLPWTDEQQQALALIFEGRISQEKIAERCRVPSRTLRDWIAHPDFQAKLKDMRADFLATCETLGIAYARKEQRVQALAAMAESARTEYEARPWLQEKRQIGVNRDVSKDDPEYGAPLYMINEAFNGEAHKAFRESLNDIAKELGDRKQVSEVAATVKHSGSVDLAGLSDEELLALEQIARKVTDETDH